MPLAKWMSCSLLCAAVLVTATPAGAQTASVAIPNTPAGTALRAMLDATSSADTARLGAYFRQYRPDVTANLALEQSFAKRTGGFQLLSVERNEPRHIEFTVKERNSAMVAYGIIEVSDAGGSTRITAQPLWAIGDNASPSVIHLDASQRAHAVAGVATLLDSAYVFPDVAKRMDDSLHARLARGAYDVETNGIALALRLDKDVRDISHDKHLAVAYRVAAMGRPPAGAAPAAAPRPAPAPGAAPSPAPSPAPAPEMIASGQQAAMDAINCGFQRVERLDGDVGYVKFDLFADPALCAPTAAAAMGFVAGMKALIVDLRENNGGSPEMVSYVLSYLFSKRTHVNDLWSRTTDKTTEFWTLDSVPSRRFGGDKPVYVLTSAHTFSGGEEFAYDLQSLKRAKIVGETTGGGAHPVAPRIVDEHFVVSVPFARAVNPATHTDWEGVGVVPDVKVPAGDALAAAEKLARPK